MTEDEKKQFDTLREQLNTANRSVDEIRDSFFSVTSKSSSEIQMYRVLFWSLLTLMGLVAF